MTSTSECTHLDSARTIARAAWSWYDEAPILMRLLQCARPFICPFQRLVDQVPAESRVLDIGCGGGLWLLILGAGGRLRSGRGVDTSFEAIGAARSAARHLGPVDLTFDVVTGSHHPAVNDLYDAVTMIDVLHHIPKARQREVFRWALGQLRPGGRLILKDMVNRPWWQALANRLHDFVLTRQWIHYVPPAEVRRWTADLGVAVVGEQRFSRGWYGHYTLVLETRGLG